MNRPTQPARSSVVLDASGTAWQRVSDDWACVGDIRLWTWEMLDRQFGPLRVVIDTSVS